ncbi:MAG: AroB-related putative sugar phosphate phospholyase (cyclizing), partial [Candidatus Margulisiibacteriota bacterium]
MSDRFTVKSIFKEYEVDFNSSLDFEGDLQEFFIIDKKIAKLYRSTLKNVLKNGHTLIVEANEFNKTIPYCARLVEKLIKLGIRKNNRLIAVGGGVIQDITGFIASILYRGIDWRFYPTTLLAQGDSCIGSKTSINLGKFKNLVGNFYPPSAISINVNFLRTLTASELKSGIGEMLHFYLISGSRIAEDLKGEYEALFSSPGKLKKYILASLGIKKRVIEIDEFDKNERNLFNYGHTFGHAIESVTGYKVKHGQAVTRGMDIANYVSLKHGYLDKGKYDYMHGILSQNLPDFKLKAHNMEAYLNALSRDKKNIGGNLGCILTKG